MSQLGGALPQALERVRQFALNEINQAMQTLFEKADGWLFEQADTMADPKSQQMYMELVRLLRNSRQSILAELISQLSASFRQLTTTHTADNTTDFDSVSVSQLSLVGHQEMDHSVALDTMAARVGRDADLALKLLTARVNHLLPQMNIAETDNPLSPKQLCRALGDTIKNTGWETPHQLVFFKLFQLFVRNGVAGFLEDCNQLLEQDGILQGKSELDILRAQALSATRYKSSLSDACSLDIAESTPSASGSNASGRDWNSVLSGWGSPPSAL